MRVIGTQWIMPVLAFVLAGCGGGGGGASVLATPAPMATGMPVITEFAAGISAGAGLDGITSGPDGALWFTEATINRIGRITTGGFATEFATGISPNADPAGITSGP